MNFFELLKIPQTFKIDLDVLDASWRSASSLVHPDRYATASATQKSVALQWASTINEAHITLKDDIKRGLHLCELAGVTDKKPLSPDFLVRQMQWHEEIEEASDNFEKLKIISQTIEKEKKDLLKCLTEILDEKKDYQLASQKLQELMFVQKILNDIS